mmetsp:Transcript_8100/g.19937  ORF Transcript_8100/g.19937 Transcript_8100/m.19937 type:complete len:293 (-) Transcript_8100:841-1719(-)
MGPARERRCCRSTLRSTRPWSRAGRWTSGRTCWGCQWNQRLHGMQGLQRQRMQQQLRRVQQRLLQRQEKGRAWVVPRASRTRLLLRGRWRWRPPGGSGRSSKSCRTSLLPWRAWRHSRQRLYGNRLLTWPTCSSRPGAPCRRAQPPPCVQAWALAWVLESSRAWVWACKRWCAPSARAGVRPRQAEGAGLLAQHPGQPKRHPSPNSSSSSSHGSSSKPKPRLARQNRANRSNSSSSSSSRAVKQARQKGSSSRPLPPAPLPSPLAKHSNSSSSNSSRATQCKAMGSLCGLRL